MFELGGLHNDLTKALKKPVDLVTTEALKHQDNAKHAKKYKEYHGKPWYFFYRPFKGTTRPSPAVKRQGLRP